MNKTLAPLIIVVLSIILGTGNFRDLQAQQKEIVKSIELPAMVFDLAAGPNRDKAAGFCTICHGTEYIPMQPRLSKAQWTATVTKMIKVFGAPIPQEEADGIIEYLSAAYGTGK